MYQLVSVRVLLLYHMSCMLIDTIQQRAEIIIMCVGKEEERGT